MAKSAAERMRIYRQKMSLEMRLIARQNNRKSQRNCRQQFSHAKKERIKFQNRTQKFLKRQQKKKSMLSKSFFSPQMLGRATSKVTKILPDSPMKRIAVVRQLATKCGIIVDKKK